MKLHSTVTMHRVVKAVERRMTTLDNPGFCIKCGEEAHDCEPDAQNSQCDRCGENSVYGADELLLEFI